MPAVPTQTAAMPAPVIPTTLPLPPSRPPPNVELLEAGTDPDQRLMLLTLQRNVGGMAGALVSVMETAVKRKADPVLIQELPRYQGSSHPAYDYLWSGGRVMTARRKDSDWTVSVESGDTREAEGDVQVLH